MGKSGELEWQQQQRSGRGTANAPWERFLPSRLRGSFLHSMVSQAQCDAYINGQALLASSHLLWVHITQSQAAVQHVAKQTKEKDPSPQPLTTADAMLPKVLQAWAACAAGTLLAQTLMKVGEVAAQYQEAFGIWVLR